MCMPTLLLADDSLTIQRVVELTFTGKDVHVVAVSDGEQAIQRLETSPPDIVLADIGMPGRNGYEVARYVKQSPRLSHIPVVLLTGAFEPVDQLRADEAGCDGVLTKPFDPQLVVNRVQELIARSQGERSSGDKAPPAPSAPSTVSAPVSNQHLPSGIESPTRVDELDEYFDRLSEAFANRLNAVEGPAAPGTSASATFETDPPAGIADVPQAGPNPFEWSSSTAGPGAMLDRPASPAAEHVDDVPAASIGNRPAALPALADAFAALLAADQEKNAQSRAAAARAVVNDDIVEEVTRRVLAQFSDGVVRETVANLVAEIAERLIREEIQRIKALIK
jgi:CheY-like chemotaxis protein